MRENDYRSAGAKALDVFAQPVHLLLADLPKPFQLDAVVETDKMHAFVVEALPRFAGSGIAEALEIELAVVAGDIVFAGDIEDFLLTEALEDLIEGVEFGSLGEVGKVARVENQVGLLEGGVDLSTATCRVPLTSVLAGLLKPMWLSLIWTNVKSAAFMLPLSAPSKRELGTPPLKDQTTAAPAHCMHFRNPRRSMLSLSLSVIASPVWSRMAGGSMAGERCANHFCGIREAIDFFIVSNRDETELGCRTLYFRYA